MAIRKVANEKLYVSEPAPEYFGNGPNPTADPAWTNANWLKSRFHFSFAEYASGPQSFGVLRVMNDDVVQPHRGFGTHPHRDMEIVTYVVQGDLTHKDSRGNKETLGRGSLQYMSAGTGIRHSEDNPGDVPVRFIQSWIVPRARGLPPNYGSYDGTAYARDDRWAHVVADANDPKAKDVPVHLQQDVNMYVAELGPDAKALDFPLADGRQAYLLCVEGSVRVASPDASKTLVMHDAAELVGPLPTLTVAPADGQPGHVLVFEMAHSATSGRPDAEL